MLHSLKCSQNYVGQVFICGNIFTINIYRKFLKNFWYLAFFFVQMRERNAHNYLCCYWFWYDCIVSENSCRAKSRNRPDSMCGNFFSGLIQRTCYNKAVYIMKCIFMWNGLYFLWVINIKFVLFRFINYSKFMKIIESSLNSYSNNLNSTSSQARTSFKLFILWDYRKLILSRSRIISE